MLTRKHERVCNSLAKELGGGRGGGGRAHVRGAARNAVLPLGGTSDAGHACAVRHGLKRGSSNVPDVPAAPLQHVNALAVGVRCGATGAPVAFWVLVRDRATKLRWSCAVSLRWSMLGPKHRLNRKSLGRRHYKVS